MKMYDPGYENTDHFQFIIYITDKKQIKNET